MRSSRRLVFVLMLLAIPLLINLSPSAYAQYENGSILGTIRDASGAPVPNANITILNTATGATNATKTDDSGNYDVPQLRVGVYTVTATAPGFSSGVAQNITVSVGNRQRIDLNLKVGAADTTVEVSDVELQIQTESSQRDQTITNQQTEGLPLVNRNYTDLLATVTGVRQAPTAATTSSNLNAEVRQGAYNVNGERSVFNNFLLDGMDNNAYGESNQGFDNQIISVPPDSVSQFSVVTNNESAEYGRSSGATINVASQSGGNQFHGTAYEFLRNTNLNAAGYFKPTLVGTSGDVPFQKPTTNRNQFGGNLGGPILKDKFFFFLDYEGLRSITKPLFALTLPTQNELNGVLTVPVSNPLDPTVVYPANTPIPTSAFNPLSLQIIDAFKTISGLPVSGSATTGVDTDDYSRLVPFRDYSDKGDLRLDYVPGTTQRYFVRISDRKETGTNFNTVVEPLDGQSSGPQRIWDRQVAVGYTSTFGANRVLDFRLGLSKTKAGKTPLSIGSTNFNIPGLPTAPNLAGGLPAIGISGGFTSFGRQTTNPQFQNPSLLDPKVNYTWIKGNHSLKFGYEWEKVWMGVLDNNPLYGQYAFGSGYSACPAGTAVPTSGSQSGGICSTAVGTPTYLSGTKVADTYFADFLFGLSNSYALSNYFEAHVRQTLQSAYAQDDWKVLSNLTLNLGLRWEYGSPYSEQHNYISNWDPVSQSVLTLSPGAAAGNGITPTSGDGVYGKTLVNPDLNDFAPRVGFAYAPMSNLSIRGGFGLSYVHYTRAGSGDILAINAPQAQFAAVTQIAPTATDHCTSPLPAQIIPTGSKTESCYVTVDQGFPSALATNFNPATDNITWVPRNTRDSYVESYYLAIQRQLFKNSLIDVAYVGNHGLKLQGFLNGNQRNVVGTTFSGTTATPVYSRPFNWPSDITEALNEYFSNYNALQVRYEQRMVAGLTLLNSFTWERSLDNASASLEGNTPSPQDANNIKAEYAQSDYNLPVVNVTSLIYDLPFGRGRQFGHDWNPLIDAVAGGWQITAINTAQAGTPFDLTYTPNSATLASTQITANYRGVNLYRPNRIAGQPLTLGNSVRQANTGYIQYVNYAALQLPATQNAAGDYLPPFGDLGRNPARTPEFNELDLDVNKRFSTPIERLKIEFRSEFYNLFNHTNLYLPSSALSGTLQAYSSGAPTPNTGTPSGGGIISSTFTPRVVQFALKAIF